jgi:aldose 1-epimerase
MDIGATILAIEAPDRHGQTADIVLGFDDPLSYLEDGPHFGGVVGRYANRIAGGQLVLDSKRYQLPLNEGKNHLHGGYQGFDRRLWKGEPRLADDSAILVFSRLSPDGEEGYPGNLDVQVEYALRSSGELCVSYNATTDQATVVNLSQHTYFNLNGHDSGSILDHEITLHASNFTPGNESLIPTGKIIPVEGTPMDLRPRQRIADAMDMSDPQVRIARGYDHNWVLDGSAFRLAVSVSARASGRTLEVYTDQPGLQFYTGNFLSDNLVGKEGVRYDRRHGLCLETQHFPDSPNQPGFPSTLLSPDDIYRSQTTFRFGIED